MAAIETASRVSSPRADARRMARVKTLSRWMAALASILAVGLAAATVFYWAATPSPTLFAHAGIAGIAPQEIGAGVRIGGLLLSMLPLGVLIWGLLQAGRCFRAFAEGRFFCTRTVRALRGFALAVVASTLLQPVAAAALSVLMSWQQPASQKALQIGIGSHMLLALLFGGMLAVIASVMTEAAVIAEEHEQFI